MTADAPRVDASLVTYTNIIYALHSLSVLIGLSTFHTIIGSFIWGLPSIIAVIMNYARRHATHGTYLESHFRWQIRTFWYAALWSVVIWAVSIPLMLILIGFPLFIAGHVALSIWIIYRVARGWIALRDKQAMYLT
ncbi:MAG TPA: hypothetical protein VNX02_09760 [Steroidobacteraceae bacterium]|nr:hypothetical protein [Steroidobacteraceae bacterium]